tara:strand:+ start:617 stop:751 length:135 start_codon:yes stop_codon:yes gene_type:complete
MVGMIRSLPHRQLRNLETGEPTYTTGSLPHRQLRKIEITLDMIE